LRVRGAVLDGSGALGREAGDGEFVVNDLVADVDGRPVFLERALDNLDGAADACAESARLRQNDLHDRLAGALRLRPRRAAAPSARVSKLVAKMALALRQASAHIAARRA